MMEDSLVDENNALEIEQLIYEYKPADVQTISLPNEDNEEQEMEDDDDEENKPEDESNL